jgi:ABC-type transport system involved in cytochrome bd biosynthesis fused ATPase/permease subunit
VIASLQRAAEGRTVVLVTHRTGALSIADRVLSLELVASR